MTRCHGIGQSIPDRGQQSGQIGEAYVHRQLGHAAAEMTRPTSDAGIVSG